MNPLWDDALPDLTLGVKYLRYGTVYANGVLRVSQGGLEVVSPSAVSYFKRDYN